MKIISKRVFRGKNIYSYKKCIRIDLDLEGYSEIPSKDIEGFNERLVKEVPELKEHKCAIGKIGGFLIRLEEGTYLSHICEHTIIALQNRLGIDVAYGKAREVKGDHYYVIFQYEYEKTGISIAELVVKMFNSFIKNENFKIKEEINRIKEIKNSEEIGPSAEAIKKGAEKNGMPVFEIEDSGYYQIGYGKQRRVIESTISNFTSCLSADIASDKLLTKRLLQIQSIPIARGEKVYNVIDLIKKATDIGYPLVLKPQYGNQGKGVILNLKNEKELLDSYNTLLKEYKEIIVEEFKPGRDFRVCVVDGKVVAVSERKPPSVIGDGKSTIAELIASLNGDEKRGEDHEKPLTKVKLTSEVLEFIKAQGYSIVDMLEVGKEVFLRKNANLSTGGIAIDCTDDICVENIDLCVRASKAIGLDICGIDISASAIDKPLKEIGGILIEINAAPGIRMHHYPSFGKERNVGEEIVKYLYNGKIKNIPVIAITGTNGKTTTTRLISHVLRIMGNNVGMTSTEGIFIDNECIDIGDDTGYESAKSILLNSDVDVAVLETARGGMIRKGLAYDLADVAIITNITEDHLGLDGVETMEDLVHVKSLVGEAVKEDGYVAINVDDYWSKTLIKRAKGKVIYFSKDKGNKLIKEKILSGGIAVFIDEGYISVVNNNRKYNVIKIDDIPITLRGKLEFNIENALGACAVLVGMNIDYCMIAKGFNSFKLDGKFNSGRFNMYSVKGRTVILDYGHNLEGIKCVVSAMKKLDSNNLIGIVGIAGDRNDDMAKRVGKYCGENLDYIFVKEDKDRRGRELGDIANVIYGAIGNSKKEICLDENEALKKALNRSEIGDIIVVFYEKQEGLLKVIENINDNKTKEEKSNLLKSSH